MFKYEKEKCLEVINSNYSLEVLEVQNIFYREFIKSLETKIFSLIKDIGSFQSPPMIVGQLLEVFENKYAIVSATTGSNYFVRIISTLEKSMMTLNSSVLLHKNSNALIGILSEKDCSPVKIVDAKDKPNVNFSDIGGLERQKQELIECIEIPILNIKVFQSIGIEPPKGVLLFGPPGTGKTILVKAMANKISASFFKAVGSEFVQKYLGEGPKLVRDLFRSAAQNSPSIVFIDEIDAIATKRFDAQTGADREVQRILIELLNQMDGFVQTSSVKVILCTNRVDTLDPALLRPGRVDRKIEFPLPDTKEKRYMFRTIVSKLNTSKDIDLEVFINKPHKLTGAVIAAICQEAGMQAIRKGRYLVLQKDFEKAYNLNLGNALNYLFHYR
mmetsp:Transcript_40967/g.63946  ORF Transcript_40967/g.63946 Transcript_40967/m.63946 type:complete len:387 (+) Transcript_40967:2376-3536(+)